MTQTALFGLIFIFAAAVLSAFLTEFVSDKFIN